VGVPGRFSEPLLYVWFTARCRSARRLPPHSGVSCLVSAPRPDHASRHSHIPFHTRSRTQPISRRGDPPRAEDTSPLALPADSERSSGCRNATLRPDQPPVGSSESSESSESTLCLSRGSSGGVGIRQRPSGFVRGRRDSSEAVGNRQRPSSGFSRPQCRTLSCATRGGVPLRWQPRRPPVAAR
jgi:hypothetical protein